MSEIYKIEDGKRYRFISAPHHETMIAYFRNLGWTGFHDEYDNPNEIWVECND